MVKEEVSVIIPHAGKMYPLPASGMIAADELEMLYHVQETCLTTDRGRCDFDPIKNRVVFSLDITYEDKLKHPILQREKVRRLWLVTKAEDDPGVKS